MNGIEVKGGFLCLTELRNGALVFMNVDSINMIRSNSSGGSCIYTNGAMIDVRESPEMIYNAAGEWVEGFYGNN